jgi:trimeric autotransporter adhesin
MRKSILSIFAFFLLFSAKTALSGWDDVGAGLGPEVRALSFYNNELYAGGTFTTPPSLGKLSGPSFVTVGSGLGSPIAVYALADYADYLYVGGQFTQAGGLPNSTNIARWNGAWYTLGNGVSGGIVKCFTKIGADLYVGGQFLAVNNTSGQVTGSGCFAKWNGSTWSSVGNGIGGTAAVVNAIVAMGTDIYAGGSFTTAGGNAIANIARWSTTSSTWSSVGTLTGTVNALAVFNGSLYAGGSFGIKRWTGSAWVDLGSGLSGNMTVNALTVYNGALTVGGNFSGAGGVPGTANIARWDGTSWYSFNSTLNGNVYALHVKALNPAELYIGGPFTNGNQGPYQGVAKYTTMPGTEELIPASDISIYPNPAQDKFTVNLSSSLKSLKADLIIYNMIGTKVKELSIIKNQATDINCREMATGIYFVKVIDGNRSFVQKMLVE